MTAYATADQYRGAVGNVSADEATTAAIEGVLDAASETLDARLHIHRGDLAPTAEQVRTFEVPPGGGRRLLYLRDAGRAHPIRELTSVVLNGVDVTADVSLRPFNERPARALHRLAGWPAGAFVTVDGAWGWETTPAAAREWTIAEARRLRDITRAGASGRVQDFDEALDAGRDDAWRILRQLAATVSRDVGLRR